MHKQLERLVRKRGLLYLLAQMVVPARQARGRKVSLPRISERLIPDGHIVRLQLTDGLSHSRGKKKATVIEEDDPKRRVLIPKVTWSVTKDKTLRELLEVCHPLARLLL